MNKQHYYHLALLGIGAIVVYILLRRQGATVAPVAEPEQGAGLPSYPNAGPINLGDVRVGGSPSYLTINNGVIPDTLGVGSGPQGAGCGCDCSPVNLTARNIVPASVVEQAAQNFQGFVVKANGALPPVDSEAA